MPRKKNKMKVYVVIFLAGVLTGGIIVGSARVYYETQVTSTYYSEPEEAFSSVERIDTENPSMDGPVKLEVDERQ